MFHYLFKTFSSLRNCTWALSEHQLGPVGAGRGKLVPLVHGGSSLIETTFHLSNWIQKSNLSKRAIIHPLSSQEVWNGRPSRRGQRRRWWSWSQRAPSGSQCQSRSPAGEKSCCRAVVGSVVPHGSLPLPADDHGVFGTNHTCRLQCLVPTAAVLSISRLHHKVKPKVLTN